MGELITGAEMAVDELIEVPGRATLTVFLTFGYFDASNNWWWAIDNVEVIGSYTDGVM